MTNNFPIVDGQMEVVVEETGEDPNHWLLGGNCEYGCQYRKKDWCFFMSAFVIYACMHIYVRMHKYMH